MQRLRHGGVVWLSGLASSALGRPAFYYALSWTRLKLADLGAAACSQVVSLVLPSQEFPILQRSYPALS